MAYSYLNNVHVILIEPGGPGNIGACARAMNNFGLGNLHLINPFDFDIEKSLERGRWAEHIILNRHSHDTLDEIIDQFQLIICSTRRGGKQDPKLELKEACNLIIDYARKGENVALVFGRERNGILKQEKRKCHFQTPIVTEIGGAGSLNLSHAVAIFCHEIYSTALQGN